MSGLQDLGFLLAIAAGFFLLPVVARFFQYMRSPQDTLENASKYEQFLFKNRSNLRIIITVILISISYWSFYLFRSSERNPEYFLDASWDYVPFSNVIVDLIIGIIAGLFIRSLIDYLTDRDGVVESKFSFAIRTIPIVVLLSVGIFRDDIRSFFHATHSIELPYLTLQFERTSETDARVEYSAQSRITTTEFQNGSINLLGAARAPFTDFEKIINFCGDGKPLYCNLPKTMISEYERLVSANSTVTQFPVDIRDENLGVISELKRKSHIDMNESSSYSEYPNRSIASYETHNIFRDSIDYALNIQKIKNCLIYFKDRYPNGVPISEELSEIAADYTMSGIYSFPTRANLPNYDWNFTKIASRVIDGAQVYIDEGGASDTNDGAKECTISPEDRKKLLHSFAFVHFRYLVNRQLWNALPENGIDLLPYRSIYDSSTLLMAGYAVEAAKHLETRLVRFDALRAARPNRALGFADFLFRLQLLSHRDSIYEVVAKKQNISSYKYLWPKKLREVSDFISAWLVSNSNIKSFALPKLLESCASGDLQFVGGDVNRPDKFEEKKLFDQGSQHDEGSFTGLTRNELEKYYNVYRGSDIRDLKEEDYLRSMIHYYVEKRYKWIESLANSGERLTRDEVEQVAEFLRMSIEGRELLARCYRDSEDATKARTWFAFFAGDALAAHAQALQQKEVVQEALRAASPTSRASLKFVCIADLALRLSLRLSEDLKLMQPERATSSGSGDKKNALDRLEDRAEVLLAQIGPGRCNAEKARKDLSELIH